MSAVSNHTWTERVEETLQGYSQELLRSVAYRLVRHRGQWPAEELIERIGAATQNAAIIDRRVRELPASCRAALALIGRSRKPSWPVGQLLSILSMLDVNDGVTPILTLLNEGLIFPVRTKTTPKLKSFEQWLGAESAAGLHVFAHPQVTLRVLGETLDLPELPANQPVRPEVSESDGLEWLLRLALVWQQIHETPLRRTLQQDFFKRDLQRLADDALLNAPFALLPCDMPDIGPLCVGWSAQCGLLIDDESNLKAVDFPASWQSHLAPAVASLWLALNELEPWDPENGWLPIRETGNAFPSVYLPLLLLLARQPANRWLHVNDIAQWMHARHPYFQSGTFDSVAAWLPIVLYGLLFQLKLLQVAAGEDQSHLVRLSPLGRWLASGNGEPPAHQEFQQTLLVQANFEVLAFRQGLSPALIAELSKFAKWKSFGSACQLELHAEQVYRGLEAGLTYDGICRLLQKHGTRPLPDNVAEALRTWANKRERIVIYGDTTLLEFESPAELDAAIARGLVEAKVTDRIGLVFDEEKIDYRQIRLTGTRDFAARPERCLQMLDDGITFTVDNARSDLLLETELSQVAVPLNGVDSRERTYRFTRESLTAAIDRGASLSSLDEWLVLRSGQPMSPAARLLATGEAAATFQVDRCTVLRTPTAELADGLMQLPQTRGLILERLGPQALLIAEENIPRLTEQIERFGQKVQPKP